MTAKGEWYWFERRLTKGHQFVLQPGACQRVYCALHRSSARFVMIGQRVIPGIIIEALDGKIIRLAHGLVATKIFMMGRKD